MTPTLQTSTFCDINGGSVELVWKHSGGRYLEDGMRNVQLFNDDEFWNSKNRNKHEKYESCSNSHSNTHTHIHTHERRSSPLRPSISPCISKFQKSSRFRFATACLPIRPSALAGERHFAVSGGIHFLAEPEVCDFDLSFAVK